MEATFQSYLTEAVYEAVQATTRGGNSAGADAGSHQQRDHPISFIDDSDGEQQQQQQHQLLGHALDNSLGHSLNQQPPPPLPVKMRVKNAATAASAAGGRGHRGPRPSGILEQLQQEDPSSPMITASRTSVKQPPASNNPSAPSSTPFWPPHSRHSKFGLSVKRRLSPSSSNFGGKSSESNFYLQRSQSTKEVGSNFSLFKNFGLKRSELTWSSVVAHLNRSFRAASTTSNETSTASRIRVEGGSKPPADKVWKRSQSCRNIERLFYNRRYHIKSFH